MPRGNDAKAALADLAEKFGRGVGNAEELIEATLRNRSRALIKAEQLPIDQAATAALDLDALKGPDGEKVVSAAVHGDVTVIVYEDERGSYRLAALDEKGQVQVEAPPDLGKAEQAKKPPANRKPDPEPEPSKE